MKIKDLFQESFKSIFIHKWRTLLSMLGVSIGIGGLALITLLTDSIGEAVHQEISAFGVTHFLIEPKRSVSSQNTARLELSDIASIKNLPLPINNIAPLVKKQVPVVSGQTQFIATLMATTPAYETMLFETLARGRFISAFDLDNQLSSCVIDQDIKDELYFAKQTAIGQQLSLPGLDCQIIGEMQPKHRRIINFIEQRKVKEQRIILPLSTYLNLAPNSQISAFIISVKHSDQIPNVAKAVINFLESRGPDQQFRYASKEREIQSFNMIIKYLTWLFYLTIAIALLVAGIGIMNVFGISVLERTSEIGIRKAVGASKGDIFFQFLMEALLVCGVAGGLGALGGTLIGSIVLRLLDIPLLLNLPQLIITLVVIVIVGVVSGVYPAKKASEKTILEAIKYDT